MTGEHGTIFVEVQARMSSTRLPGKVMRPLAGKPALTHVLARMERRSSVAGTVVATSVDASEDPVADSCRRRGTPCVRGPLDGITARATQVFEELSLAVFARVSRDSLPLDPATVDRAAARFETSTADIVTNVVPRTCPHGQPVDVIDAGAFAAAREPMTSPSDREHVTLALDPIFTVIAIGGDAHDLVVGLSDDCLGADSICDRLLRRDGRVCNIKDLGNPRHVACLIRLDADARATGAARAARVGRGEISLIRARAMANLIVAGLERDPEYLVLGEKAGIHVG